MSKIKIDFIVKGNNDYRYKGNAIKNGNVITFKDNEIFKIIIDKDISIERNNSKLVFSLNNLTKYTYSMDEGIISIDIYTNYLKIRKNDVIIKYETRVNNCKIDDFEIKLVLDY